MHSEQKLNQHLEGDCHRIITKLPNPNENTSFKSFHKGLKAPIVVYADFECALNPIDTCSNDPVKRQKKRIAQHEPTSFGYYIKCSDESRNKYVQYRGPDCPKRFVECLMTDLKTLFEDYILDKCAKMIITRQQIRDHISAKDCHICGKPLNGDKVKDHCHLTGKHFHHHQK
jgi:hypothetical protein